MTNEKRETERIPVPGQVTGEITVFQPMMILDISERGAQVETSFKLQLEGLHDLRLSLGAQSVVVKGRIVHCQIRELTEGTVTYRTGIEFIQPSPHAQMAIEAFVETQRAARAAPPIVDGVIAEDGV
jgi:PilZ domain